MPLAPIALFVYNRPEHTRLCLEALSQNELFRESVVYIFSDGPKQNITTDELLRIKEVRKLIKGKEWGKQTFIIEKENNEGLAQSIINGVTEVLDEHGKIIVLEDDLIVSSGFLKFMNNSLNLYEDERQVMSVTGYCPPIPHHDKLETSLLSGITSTWGWGTWTKAWSELNLDCKSHRDEIYKNGLVKKFNLENSYNYTGILEKQISGSVDSWGICWYASVFRSQGLVLWPSQSLLNNIGHDGSGVHCEYSTIYEIELLAEEIPTYLLEVKESVSFRNKFINYYKKRNKIPLIDSIKDGINRIVGGILNT